jgi:chromosome segregation ATPase
MEGFYLVMLLILTSVVASRGQRHHGYLHSKIEDLEFSHHRVIEAQKLQIRQNAEFADSCFNVLYSIMLAADDIHIGFKNEKQKLEKKFSDMEEQVDFLESALEINGSNDLHHKVMSQMNVMEKIQLSFDVLLQKHEDLKNTLEQSKSKLPDLIYNLERKESEISQLQREIGQEKRKNMKHQEIVEAHKTFVTKQLNILKNHIPKTLVKYHHISSVPWIFDL